MYKTIVKYLNIEIAFENEDRYNDFKDFIRKKCNIVDVVGGEYDLSEPIYGEAYSDLPSHELRVTKISHVVNSIIISNKSFIAGVILLDTPSGKILQDMAEYVRFKLIPFYIENDIIRFLIDYQSIIDYRDVVIDTIIN